MEIFRKLGPLVRKHKNLVVTVWVLVFVSSLPAALYVRENTQASDILFLPNSEATGVSDIVRTEFSNYTNADLMVVLETGGQIDLEDPVLREKVEKFRTEVGEGVLVRDLFGVEEELQLRYDLVLEDFLRNRVAPTVQGYLTNTSEDLAMLGLQTQTLSNNMSSLRGQISELRESLLLAEELTSMMSEVSWLYTSMYWNVSRIIYYLAANTTAYQAGLTPTDLNVLQEWVVNSSGLDQSLVMTTYQGTNVSVSSGIQLGEVVYPSLESVGAEVLTDLTYEFTNQTLRTSIPTSSGNLPFLFLNSFNHTFVESVSNGGIRSVLNYTNSSLPEAHISQQLVVQSLNGLRLQSFNQSQLYLSNLLAEQGLTSESALVGSLVPFGESWTEQERYEWLDNVLASQELSSEEVQLLTPLRSLVVEGYNQSVLQYEIVSVTSTLVDYSIPNEVLVLLYDMTEPSLDDLTPVVLTLANQYISGGFGDLVRFVNIPGGLPEINLEEVINYIDPSHVTSVLYQAVVGQNDLVETESNLTSDILSNLTTGVNDLYPKPSIMSPSFPIGIRDQFISSDQKVLVLMVSSEAGYDWNAVLVNEIRENIHTLFQGTTYTPYLTGSKAIEFELQEIMEEDVEKIDVTTVILVLVLLSFVFLSFIAPTVPIISIGAALVCGHSILFAVVQYQGNVPTMMLSVMTVIAFGAGVDYIIFILNRYKEERSKNVPISEAIDKAVEHSGESVFSSGLTVMVGFGALAMSSFSFLSYMGVGPMIAVALSLMSALTFIPALLSFMGDKLFWPMKFGENKKGVSLGTKVRHFLRLGKVFSWTPSLRQVGLFITHHPKKIIFLSLVVSAPFIAQVASLETSYDIRDNLPSTAESARGYNVVADHFTDGKVLPLQVLVHFQEPVIGTGGKFDSHSLHLVETIRGEITSLSYVTSVSTLTAPLGLPLDYSSPDTLNRSLMTMFVSDDGFFVVMDVVFSVPPLSNQGLDHLDDLRELLRSQVQHDPVITNVVLGGSPASYDELASLLAREEPFMVVFVLVGIFLVLTLLMRSIFTPIRLEFTILLSVLVSLGATKWLFVDVLGEAIPWVAPIMLFVVLFGLGMDYDIFLVTRMKEEVKKGLSDQEAVVEALVSTGGIIMTCGIIMACALGTLLISSSLILRVLGFAFFFAILLDAFVVRLFLVPAIMMVFGRWNWWMPSPTSIPQLLPKVRRTIHRLFT